MALTGLFLKIPRQVTRNNARTFTPLQTLGLGSMWDDYMDKVFKTAKDKGTSFIDDNIKLLKEEYPSQDAKDKAKDDPQKDPSREKRDRQVGKAADRN
jgi:hypothetical protein